MKRISILQTYFLSFVLRSGMAALLEFVDVFKSFACSHTDNKEGVLQF